MSAESPARLRLDDLHEGLTHAFTLEVTPELIDAFAAVSGDRSPIHMSAGAAAARGFAGRVAHGALLCAFVSRLAGMHLPGERALVHSLQMKFAAPVLAGDRITITGRVDLVSAATQTVVVSITISGAGPNPTRATGRMQVGVAAETATMNPPE